MSSEIPVLSGQSLTCIKRDRVLFEDLSLSLRAGECVYLRGPNGAGKTSLLRILVGLSAQDGGDVLYRGTPLKQVRSEFAADSIYFGHKPGINGTLNATENLSYWCQQHGVSVSEQEVWQVLATLGLVGLEDVPCNQLSAGQLRRVALSRLWLKPHASLWVLDEPFTALDAHGVELLERKISHHVKDGGAVLMTSHQPPTYIVCDAEIMLEYRI
ncbi:cytochrome c biogenesis heme-transporting ATPase CcmA [Aestuariibacter salexigens]|uniref:cytochrome c biogenesis heme-transporting ATPase CcmA n=1 Tax=Aestuariibacter salexigens TaxID=226010 RepID=UPI0004220730|nr:cytochrome c biogenesis heme-transporting ATPase CcmA [Aestuariibacter salexigens]